MTKLSPALDAAISYAAHGLRAFPLKARSKEPATAHGFKDATTEGGVLHRRFTAAGPDANVAVATGGGIVVVDLDGPEAEAWARTADLPRTWTAATGRGRHLYYRAPAGVPTRPGLAPKVDLKGEGGYVVAPPSVHPSGARYAWKYGGPGSQIPIADAPRWLLEAPERPRTPESAPGDAFPAVINDGEGRESSLVRLAGMLRRQGLGEGEVLSALRAFNDSRIRPPKPDKDLERIARSVGRYAPDPVAIADERLRARAAQRPQRVKARDDAEPAELLDDLPGVLAADVQSRAVRWLWKGRLPAGMLVILDGDPGLGKSTIVADWIARVTTGTPWPDGQAVERGGAIYVGAEDPAEEVVVPRLRAAGADLSLVRIVTTLPVRSGERLPVLPRDIGVFERAIAATGARLLVFDPIISYVAPDLSSYSDKDVRQALTPLADMLAGTGCTGLMLRHLRKDDKASSAMYRGGGSIAFVAVARAGFAVSKVKGADGATALMPTKANLSKKPRSLRYAIEDVELDGGVETSRVAWGDETDDDPDESMTAFGADTEGPRLKAAEILMEALMEGPRPEREVEARLRAAAISPATYRRARKDQGVLGRQVNGDGRWWLALPEHADKLALVGAVRGGDGRLYATGGRGTPDGPSRARAQEDLESEHPHSKGAADVSIHPDSDAITSDAHPSNMDAHEKHTRACVRCGHDDEPIRRRGRAICGACGAALDVAAA